MNPLEIKDYVPYEFPVETQAESQFDFPVEKPVDDDFMVKIDRWKQFRYAGEWFVELLLVLLLAVSILMVVGAILLAVIVWALAYPLISGPILGVLALVASAAWVLAGRDLKKQAKARYENQ